MKKILLALVLLTSAFNVVSCDVEPVDSAVIPDPTTPTNPSETGSFTVKIDGAPYTALTTQAYISGGSIQLAALRANGDSFGFIIGGTTAGTYAANQNLLAFTQSSSEFGWQSVNPANAGENTGSVTITAVNTTAHTFSGTFHFKGYWSDADNTTVAPKEFTDGVFTNIPYTDQSPTADTFAATVNGSAFSVSDIFASEVTVGATSVISVAGTSGSANITVSVASDITAGSYPITGSLATDHVQVAYQTSTGGGGVATSGTVVVTQKTADRVKGTFNATVVDGTTTTQITSGTFDVAY